MLYRIRRLEEAVFDKEIQRLPSTSTRAEPDARDGDQNESDSMYHCKQF